MPRSGVSWSEDLEKVLIRGTLEYKAGLEKQFDALVQRYAPLIENWMKENAPWEDRTTHARQSLRARIEFEINEIFINMYYENVSYDVFLEYAHSGRYSILAPALDYWSPVLWREIKAIIEQ